MAWKPEVIADNTGKWYDNALRFATEQEAKDNARDLANRWFSVREWRATECSDPVTHTYTNGVLGDAPFKPPVFLGYGDNDGD